MQTSTPTALPDTAAYNPVFVAYASAHDRTAQAQRDHDRTTHPAASAMPFILWVQEQKREFVAQGGYEPDTRAFHVWLVGEVAA